MAITAAFPLAAKLAALIALCPSGNSYKCALYTSATALDKNTSVYTSVGEVVGDGYTAGGKVLTGYAAVLDGDVAILDFADPIWDPATISARGAMIYDATDGNKVRAVLLLGASDIVSTNGPFQVQIPAPAAATAVIKIG